MPRPYILAETNWKAVKATDYDLAILPWAATEAHNYHLPYATDIIEGEAISDKGVRFFRDVTEEFARLFIDLANVDKDDFYE